MGRPRFGIGPENATCVPASGELALYPGGQSETELLFPYGYCSFASKAGHLWANHFATLVEGAEQLPELGRLASGKGRSRSRSARFERAPVPPLGSGTRQTTPSVGGDAMKGSQKPKKLAKKPAQKTLKEKRSEKRAAGDKSNSSIH